TTKCPSLHDALPISEQDRMKQEIENQQSAQREERNLQMEEQQAEQQKEMQKLKKQMQEKQEEQADMLGTLGKGLATMGENLHSISENIKTMHDYSDMMTAELPKNQATLDDMIYDDSAHRPKFEEVVVDDNNMVMMVKLEGNTTDEEKNEVVEMINNYLDKEKMDTIDTLVSGKPVLDNAIKSSMQGSIQKMMGLALIIMVVVLF